MTVPWQHWPVTATPATASGPEFAPDLPTSTGNVIDDTLAALRAIRLAVALAGPKVTYSIHGHTFDWNEYQRVLDGQIQWIMKERAIEQPFEEIGQGFGCSH